MYLQIQKFHFTLFSAVAEMIVMGYEAVIMGTKERE